jgi:chorismate synthase
MFSTLNQLFRVTTWGESHGPALGCVIDGCPAGLRLDLDAIQAELRRRRPGQSKLVTPRQEDDQVQILSGLFEGLTTGAPISLLIHNHDADASKYEPWREVWRPSHADYTYDAKWGLRDWRGGGRASARETAARVAAGAIARQILAQHHQIEIVAWVEQVGHLRAQIDRDAVTAEQVEAHPTRCPDPDAADAMAALIQEARVARDSLGGVIGCVARNVPVGLGEPVFDRAEARLAAAMMSLPASRGFEVGAGFEGAAGRGSERNDAFFLDPDSGKVRPRPNHSGGVQGGITNGMPLWMRVAFKPVATLARPQETLNRDLEPVEILMKGRHDPCVLPRAVPIVEAMTALVLLDLLMIHNARASLQRPLPEP